MSAELIPIAFVLIGYITIELVRWKLRPEARRLRRVRQLKRLTPGVGR